MAAFSKILQFQPTRKHFFFVALVTAAMMLFLSMGAAINIDEIPHNDQARKVVNWYLTLGSDQSCLDTGVTNLKYYGQSVDNLSAFVNRMFSIENEFATRHLTGWIFSWLLLLAAGLLAVELTGSYGVGILAFVLMFISPRLMGQAYSNLKDIPFAAGYAWSLLFMIRFFKSLPSPRWKEAWLLGLVIAFTNSVRIGGLVLFGYFGLFLIVWLLLQQPGTIRSVVQPKTLKPLILKILVVFVVGYFLGLILWPYGLLNPFRNPLEALSVMEHYKVSIKQVFEGVQVWSTNLPWYYLPKWMLISIPEIVLVGFLLSILYFFRQKGDRLKGQFFQVVLVGFVFLFPAIYVIAINANLYSDWRQMYFIYAPMVVFAATGISFFYRSLQNKGVKLASVGLVFGLILLPLIHTARTYPSDYIYFNTLAGTGKNCWENYEYDYYRHEMKKAALWLRHELSGSGTPVMVASNFDVTSYFPGNKNIGYQYVHFYDKNLVAWDYALLGVNYVHPYQLKNNTWQPAGVLKTFYHKGNPTVVVLKGQDKNAYNGYAALQNKEFGKAARLLEKAAANDPTDLNILACLGESYLALSQFSDVKNVVERGENLNPHYEHFMLLDAKQAIKLDDYQGGLNILKKLVKENPRYFKAIPYLIDCYEKTGDTIRANQLRNYSNV